MYFKIEKKLRQESARVISSMDFDGFGISGSFVKEDMSSAVRWVNEILPEEKPRHLLGIGETLRNHGYSRAYIAHLFHGKEMLAGTLASIHNLYFIVNLVKKIRQSIIDDTFYEYKKEFLERYLKSEKCDIIST